MQTPVQWGKSQPEEERKQPWGGYQEKPRLRVSRGSNEKKRQNFSEGKGEEIEGREGVGPSS